jgi:hypothetical protein
MSAAPEMPTVSDLDEAWFKRHPNRNHRVRRRIPGEPGLPDDGPHELAPKDLPAYVALRRGSSVKVPFWGTRPPRDDEASAELLWVSFCPGGLNPTALALPVGGAA